MSSSRPPAPPTSSPRMPRNGFEPPPPSRTSSSLYAAPSDQNCDCCRQSRPPALAAGPVDAATPAWVMGAHGGNPHLRSDSQLPHRSSLVVMSNAGRALSPDGSYAHRTPDRRPITTSTIATATATATTATIELERMLAPDKSLDQTRPCNAVSTSLFDSFRHLPLSPPPYLRNRSPILDSSKDYFGRRSGTSHCQNLGVNSIGSLQLSGNACPTVAGNHIAHCSPSRSSSPCRISPNPKTAHRSSISFSMASSLPTPQQQQQKLYKSNHHPQLFSCEPKRHIAGKTKKSSSSTDSHIPLDTTYDSAVFSAQSPAQHSLSSHDTLSSGPSPPITRQCDRYSRRPPFSPILATSVKTIATSTSAPATTPIASPTIAALTARQDGRNSKEFIAHLQVMIDIVLARLKKVESQLHSQQDEMETFLGLSEYLEQSTSAVRDYLTSIDEPNRVSSRHPIDPGSNSTPTSASTSKSACCCCCYSATLSPSTNPYLPGGSQTPNHCTAAERCETSLKATRRPSSSYLKTYIAFITTAAVALFALLAASYFHHRALYTNSLLDYEETTDSGLFGFLFPTYDNFPHDIPY